MSSHTETAFEEAIEAGLIEAGRFVRRAPSDYDAD